MSFIFTTAIAEKRACPKYGKVIVAPINMKHDKVTDKLSGAIIASIKSG